jgi:phospholipid/cholesterol/gamma-HCH transport system substrate-binding protein
MENRSYALMTGFFTVALLVAAILIGLWLNRDRTTMHPYEIVTTQTIPGLNPQATVRYRGLEVGRVDDIVFDPRVTGQILIKLSIEEGTPVTKTTFASLGYQGVTGIAFIQLDDDRTGSPLLASDKDHVARIPLRPGLLDQLEKRGLAILEKTERITDSLNNVLSKENQDKLTGAFDSINKAAAAYAEIPGQRWRTSWTARWAPYRSFPPASPPPRTTTTASRRACRPRAARSNAPARPSIRWAA